jgi:hypothetical protein
MDFVEFQELAVQLRRKIKENCDVMPPDPSPAALDTSLALSHQRLITRILPICGGAPSALA